jgi:hypothetical protein
LKPIHLFIQDELLRNRELGQCNSPVTVLETAPGWEQTIRQLDQELDGGQRPLVIASIQMCNFITRHAPKLARGVVADYEKCHFSRSIPLAPPGLALNQSYILLPFGELISRCDQLQKLYGERVFLRPDDSRKSFSGFSVHIDDLPQEASSLRQIHCLHNDELCVVDAHQDIKRTEYRCWLIAGAVATTASYSHFGPTSRPTPSNVLDAASRLAKHMELYHDAAVADFAIDANGSIRLIEVNAISTSGVYPGANINDIVQAMDMMLL